MLILPDSPNRQAIPFVGEVFREHEARTRELLPELPADLQLYVNDEGIIPEKGVGGYAYSPTIMTLGVRNDFKDKSLQRDSLADTILHEGYHMVQGHTGNPTAPHRTALDNAVYEGCATKFELVYGVSRDAPWGDYSKHSREELEAWASKLESFTDDVWRENDGKLWRQWSFYDHEDGTRWKAYKAGVWLVDKYLAQTQEDIRDLRHRTAAEILDRLT